MLMFRFRKDGRWVDVKKYSKSREHKYLVVYYIVITETQEVQQHEHQYTSSLKKARAIARKYLNCVSLPKSDALG